MSFASIRSITALSSYWLSYCAYRAKLMTALVGGAPWLRKIPTILCGGGCGVK